VVSKLCGERSLWESPVDAFCGLPDARCKGRVWRSVIGDVRSVLERDIVLEAVLLTTACMCSSRGATAAYRCGQPGSDGGVRVWSCRAPGAGDCRHCAEK
jgi:hypothetical protein